MTKVLVAAETILSAWELGQGDSRGAALEDLAGKSLLVTTRKFEKSIADLIANAADPDFKAEVEHFANNIARVDVMWNPNPEITMKTQSRSLREILDSSEFRRKFERSSISPYLEGEDQNTALERLFGSFFHCCRDLTILDRYAGKQLGRHNSGINKILQKLNGGASKAIEIHTVDPDQLASNGGVTLEKSWGVAETYSKALRANGNALETHFHADQLSGSFEFPHARLWRFGFDHGVVWVALDNGTDVFSRVTEAPVKTLIPAERQLWDSAWQKVQALRVSAISDGR